MFVSEDINTLFSLLLYWYCSSIQNLIMRIFVVFLTVLSLILMVVEGEGEFY